MPDPSYLVLLTALALLGLGMGCVSPNEISLNS